MRRTTALSLLLLSACASSGTRSTISSTISSTSVETGAGTYSLSAVDETHVTARSVNAPPEAVRQALPRAFQALEIEAGEQRTGEWVYGNPGLRARGRLAGKPATLYLDCGTNPIGAARAQSDMLQVSILAALQPEPGGGTQVRLQLQGTATEPAGSTRAACTSTGKLEARLLEEIQRLVGTRG